jgi:hypothetical protein
VTNGPSGNALPSAVDATSSLPRNRKDHKIMTDLEIKYCVAPAVEQRLAS